MIIEIEGRDVTLEELKLDVIGAHKNGLTGKFAFTPATVEGLINKLEASSLNFNESIFRVDKESPIIKDMVSKSMDDLEVVLVKTAGFLLMNQRTLNDHLLLSKIFAKILELSKQGALNKDY